MNTISDYTTPLTRRQEILQIISDAYKDAYGFRPKGINWSSYSDAELEDELDRLCSISDANAAAETKVKETAAIKFEELINKTIALGASDRKTALQWLWDGSDDPNYEINYFLYQYNISYTDYGNKIKKELNDIFAANSTD